MCLNGCGLWNERKSADRRRWYIGRALLVAMVDPPQSSLATSAKEIRKSGGAGQDRKNAPWARRMVGAVPSRSLGAGKPAGAGDRAEIRRCHSSAP